MTTSNSQEVAGTALGTAQNLTWSGFFEYLVITNDTANELFVQTDGSVATTGGNGEDVVLPNSTAVFPNRQPKQTGVPGTDRTASTGWTAQKYNVPASGALTYVSLICATAPSTGNVLVSPQ